MSKDMTIKDKMYDIAENGCEVGYKAAMNDVLTYYNELQSLRLSPTVILERLASYVNAGMQFPKRFSTIRKELK